MSPELETLDQLLGGDLPLRAILALFPSERAFGRGVRELLSSGDIVLVTLEGVEVPHWQWRELFGDKTVFQRPEQLRLGITPQGTRKVS